MKRFCFKFTRGADEGIEVVNKALVERELGQVMHYQGTILLAFSVHTFVPVS